MVEYVTMEHVARKYGVSYQSVRKMVLSGEIPSVRLGKRTIRIPADWVPGSGCRERGGVA